MTDMNFTAVAEELSESDEMELAMWLAGQTWSDFATSLAKQFNSKGALSVKQWAAALKMKGTCDAKAAAKAAKGETAVTTGKKEQAEVGLYLLDGEVYKVQNNKAGTNRYAKRLVGAKSWDYAAGKVYELTEAHKVTAEMAHDYGMAKGHCVNCGLEIGYGEDQRAVAMGFGAHCAKINGWAFPTMKEFNEKLAKEGELL